MARSMVGGIDARIDGRSALIWSQVAMMLAPGWRLMISSVAGLPLAYPALRTSSTESKMWATSDRCSTPPLRYESTSVWYGAALNSWSLVLSAHTWLRPEIEPLGVLVLARPR